VSRLRAFMRRMDGTSAAEFALVLPLALLLLFGIIDAGRYIWEVNQVQKAAEAGARYAVATAIVPSGLNTYDTVGFACPSGTLVAGDPICREALGTIRCATGGGSVSCTCAQSPCPNLGAPNSAAFANIVARMRVFAPQIRPANVVVSYSGSGLGYAGDPATDDDGNPLSDIAPIVTVEVRSFDMRALLLFGGDVSLPGASATLTLEDGDGRKAN